MWTIWIKTSIINTFLPPAEAGNNLNAAYLSQKQLDLVTRITTATQYYNVAACGLSEKAAYASLIKAQRNYKDTQALFDQGGSLQNGSNERGYRPGECQDRSAFSPQFYGPRPNGISVLKWGLRRTVILR